MNLIPWTQLNRLLIVNSACTKTWLSKSRPVICAPSNCVLYHYSTAASIIRSIHDNANLLINENLHLIESIQRENIRIIISDLRHRFWQWIFNNLMSFLNSHFFKELNPSRPFDNYNLWFIFSLKKKIKISWTRKKTVIPEANNRIIFGGKPIQCVNTHKF